MDMFLKSLSFSSTTILEDVTYACMKILDWIYKTIFSTHSLTYKDVENIGKGIVYLNNCYMLFEEELPNRLLEQYPYFTKQLKTVFGNTISDYYRSVAQIFDKVARTQNGAEHIYTLEAILNIANDSGEMPISLEYSFGGDAKESSSVVKMRTLAQRIFQLPKEQINTAIDRMLNNVPFSVIGHCFCEPENSFYSDITSILGHKICEKLLNGSISALFVRSLYVTTAFSQGDRRFYWLCLKNMDFKNAMSTFFIRALTHLSKKRIEWDENIEDIVFEKHRLCQVLYLIWAALSNLSPCQCELYNQIVDAGLGSHLLFLNKFDRIYD